MPIQLPANWRLLIHGVALAQATVRRTLRDQPLFPHHQLILRPITTKSNALSSSPATGDQAFFRATGLTRVDSSIQSP